jgi:hypothetical protein
MPNGSSSVQLLCNGVVPPAGVCANQPRMAIIWKTAGAADLIAGAPGGWF